MKNRNLIMLILIGLVAAGIAPAVAADAPAMK